MSGSGQIGIVSADLDHFLQRNVKPSNRCFFHKISKYSKNMENYGSSEADEKG
jgi:hypothetical protein